MSKNTTFFVVLIITVAVFLFCVFYFVNEAFADEYFVICRPGSEVNVREKAKISSPVVACLTFGRKVEADDERNGFTHVTGLNAETESGWIYSGLLVKDEPVQVDMMTSVFGTWRVACRKYADQKSKLVRWAYEDEPVRVYAVSEEWCVTDRGYIKTDFLTINAKVR